jgi:hypothetical protein
MALVLAVAFRRRLRLLPLAVRSPPWRSPAGRCASPARP